MSKPQKVVIKKSNKEGKKLMAIFTLENGRTRTIHFGAEGMTDYTLSKDDERKKRYLARHRKNENWNNPLSAGALSRWILWNKKTRGASISDYKRRFNLK
jgi:hypothetical protein